MKLFIPGPVNIAKKFRTELARDMVGHRTDDFKKLHKNITKNINDLFKTKNLVFLMTCSATGAMEAAIRNTVKKNVLCIANGAFGRRWCAIAKANNKNADLLDFGDGVVYDYKKIDYMLKNKEYDAVTVVINDTATGIENNMEELKQIMKKYPKTCLLADAVTAAFGTDIKLNGIDVLIFGTQKCLALPPGLAIAIVDKNMITQAKTIRARGFYFDFIKFYDKAKINYTPTTPNIPLLFALDKKLENIKKIGIKKYIDNHRKKRILVQDFFLKNGFDLLVDEDHRSNTVTVIKAKKNIQNKQIIRFLANQNLLIANGYGDLKERTFRIGHMGVSLKETEILLDTIAKVL